MRRLIIPLVLVAFALAACGDDEPAGAGDGPADGDGDTGTLAVRLEELDGVLIEGFALGIRVETPDGEVLDAVLWDDVVESVGSDDPDAYYDAVYELEVPAGEVVVLAELNVGIGPAPSVPDLEGDLPCELPVEVGPGERVEVEVSFDGSTDCLRLVEDATAE
jgi:hypothetical protein